MNAYGGGLTKVISSCNSRVLNYCQFEILKVRFHYLFPSNFSFFPSTRRRTVTLYFAVVYA